MALTLPVTGESNDYHPQPSGFHKVCELATAMQKTLTAKLCAAIATIVLSLFAAQWLSASIASSLGIRRHLCCHV
jgi:hypothetical protein